MGHQISSRTQDLLRICFVGLHIHSITSAITALTSAIVRCYSGLLDKISVFSVVNLLGLQHNRNMDNSDRGNSQAPAISH